MKVFTAQQMRDMETQAYHEGASEEAFMEKAGAGIARIVEAYQEIHDLPKTVFLLCAKGNNSGDAYVAGRYLLQAGFAVEAVQVVEVEACSPLCIKNHQRFVDAGGKVIKNMFPFPHQGIILDGLFGTGFKGKLQEPFASLVKAANASQLPILAIDIPSGLNGDTGTADGDVIHATETIFLGAPKRGFFLNEGWDVVGKLRWVNFGLPEKFIKNTTSNLVMITDQITRSLLPAIKRSWHKYERGYVTGLAGSPDMPGAAILASWSALTAGAGIVRLIHQENMQTELSSAPVELVRQTYHIQNLDPVMESMNKASACFVGPGMGLTSETFSILKHVLSHLTKPCVLDADALTMISGKDIILPNNIVLTPHHGEMMRLLGLEKQKLSTEELLKRAQNFVEEKKVTLVLKGSPTFILQAGLPTYVNVRGDPGMATAGSGDVLTGIIASLMSQHLNAHEAAILGVYLHSIAGEYAARAKTSRCVLASDLIFHLPDAYHELMSASCCQSE